METVTISESHKEIDLSSTPLVLRLNYRTIFKALPNPIRFAKGPKVEPGLQATTAKVTGQKILNEESIAGRTR